MGGAGDKVGPRHRAWVLIACDKAGDMGHVNHEERTMTLANF